MNLLERIQQLLRRPSTHLPPRQEALREPPEQAPPGRPFVGITTDDVDRDTGRLYPDFLERRAAREAKRQPEPAELCALDWDVRPK